MKRIAVLTLAALTLVLLAAAGPGQEFQEKRVVAVVGPDGVQKIEISGGDYYFDPNLIVVKINVPVELVVKKVPGASAHNIVLKAPEAGISFEVPLKDEPTSLKFTPTKAGRYPFECSKKFLFFKSHSERGMHGVLEVVE